MRFKFYTITIVLILSFTKIYAQPEISYIIPDLGTSGMNTYVEFITPFDKFTTGIDGFYMNQSGDEVRIYPDPTHPNADNIIVGPVVVSWTGRTFSTQVFVHPWLISNSWDWELLNDDYIIPLIVEVNGEQSNPEDYYVVRPFEFGNKLSSTERVLGQGVLGKRSPRGAMLVDYMVLANDEYTISFNDPDPDTPGNQAYLPFVLLSKGRIEGGQNTVINASGGAIVTQDAGPGGGGGGGRFYDQALVSPTGNRNGGNGFVGGGAGGINFVISGTGNYSNSANWDGTGSDNKSINGVPTPINIAWESSGGATGHPFGLSGLPCGSGGSCENSGAFGAGSGHQQNQPGGAGGYSSSGDGNTVLVLLSTGGNAHGNKMVVPIAGGSGGASGNPQGSNIHSGSGGGGGGAIRIFADTLISVRVLANGGDGGQGSGNSHGGSGSGGYMGLYTKLGASNFGFSAIGGTRSGRSGGAGRLRFDSRNYIDPPSFADRTESVFFGISTDTTQYVNRNFNMRGTLERISGKADVYMRPQSGQWELIDSIDGGFTGYWTKNYDLPVTANVDSIFYIMLVKEVDTPSGIQYLFEPEYVLSQAAGNVLIAASEPEIVTEPLNIEALLCEDDTYTYEVEIVNLGLGKLIMNYNNFWMKDGTERVTLEDTDNNEAEFLDTLRFTVRYTVMPGVSGIFTDSLFIGNNSIDGPVGIEINFNLTPIEIGKYENENINSKITNDSLFLGKICRNDIVSRSFYIRNETNFDMNLSEPSLVRDNGFEIEHLGNKFITPDEFTEFEISFTKLDVEPNIKRMYNTIYFYAEECPGMIIDSLVVWLEYYDPAMASMGTLDFGDVNAFQIVERDLVITNTGDGPLYFDSIDNFIDREPFRIIGITPALPFTLQVGETFTLRIRARPTGEGGFINFIDANSVKNGNSCPAFASFEMIVNGLQPLFEATPEIDFGTVAWCLTPTDTIAIKNPAEATASFNITSHGEIVGPDAASFSITSAQKTTPLTVAPNDPPEGVKYFIRFDPSVGGPGEKRAEFVIRTDFELFQEITVPLRGYAESYQIESDIDEIDFGLLAFGVDYSEDIVLTNNGNLTLILSSISIPSPDIQVTPTTATLLPGESQTFTITASTMNEVVYDEDIRFVFETEGETVCSGETVINIKGRAFWASLGVRNDPMDLGTTTPCRAILDTLYMFSDGAQVPIVINDIRLTGNASGLFALEPTGDFVIYDTLYSDRERPVIISFTTDYTPAGNYTATLEVDLFLNGRDSTAIIPITARVEDPHQAINAPDVVFGTHFLGASGITRQITLTNNSALPIILGIYDLIADKFVCIAGCETDIVLQPGESHTITIEFITDEIGDFTATLEFLHTVDLCVYTESINITGTVSPAAKLVLSIPTNLIADPRDRNFKIPVYAELDRSELDPNFPIRTVALEQLSLEFNGSLFYPTAVSRGNINASSINTLTGKRELQIAVPGIDIEELSDTPIVLFEIEGMAMLGNATATDIEIMLALAGPEQLISEVEYTGGRLEIEICEEGGDRLLNFDQTFAVEINPNPASDRLEIEIVQLELGQYTLDIYDITGMKIRSITWQNLELGSAGKAFEINTADYPTGVYYISVKSPSEVIAKPLLIVK